MMAIEDNPNVIKITQVSEEEAALLISKRKVYAKPDKECPWCGSMTLQEDTYGYEKVVSCSHCEYSESKTI